MSWMDEIISTSKYSKLTAELPKNAVEKETAEKERYVKEWLEENKEEIEYTQRQREEEAKKGALDDWKENNSKGYLQSRTVVAAIVVILTAVNTILSSFGFNFEFLSSENIEAMSAFFGLIAGGLVIFYRGKAERPIKNKLIVRKKS